MATHDFPACLHYKDDKLHVCNTKTGEVYPVTTFTRSTNTRWHVTFFTSWGEKYWGMMGENGNFTAKKYINYSPVGGGSGHHNVTYIRNKRGV